MPRYEPLLEVRHRLSLCRADGNLLRSNRGAGEAGSVRYMATRPTLSPLEQLLTQDGGALHPYSAVPFALDVTVTISELQEAFDTTPKLHRFTIPYVKPTTLDAFSTRNQVISDVICIEALPTRSTPTPTLAGPGHERQTIPSRQDCGPRPGPFEQLIFSPQNWENPRRGCLDDNIRGRQVSAMEVICAIMDRFPDHSVRPVFYECTLYTKSFVLLRHSTESLYHLERHRSVAW